MGVAPKVMAFFVKWIWPFIRDEVWPVIEPTLREWVLSLVARASGRFRQASEDSAGERRERAEEKAEQADERARTATDDEARIRAEAEAQIWREVARDLVEENERLKQRYDDIEAQLRHEASEDLDQARFEIEGGHAAFQIAGREVALPTHPSDGGKAAGLELTDGT